jgi:hypothetical protein
MKIHRAGFPNDPQGSSMPKLKLVPFVLASLFAAPAAHADVTLIAIGALSGNAADKSTRTAGGLENGVAGNLLGGMGSGLAYAGCNNFIAIPDRGPNAVPYNGSVDDTTSYINRFQTLELRLLPAAPGSSLPFILSPLLKATTLLSSKTPLVYGSGTSLSLAGGAPALNKPNAHYFSGRSDNFDAAKLSTDSLDGRLDPEGVRVSSDGKSLFISDEYGPYVYRFDRATGRRVGVFTLPAKFAVSHLSSAGAAEIGDNTAGRVANKGMEGLAIAPDGMTLFGAMQSPLIQDGGTNAAVTRIVRIDIATGATHEFAYALTNIGSAANPKYGTVSEIVAINDHEFLVDERDGKGRGDNSNAAFKRLFRIDLANATEVSGLSGASNLLPWAVPKQLFLDVVGALNAYGIGSKDIPAKLEGVAFGPDTLVDGALKHTIFVANDNDFIGTVVDSNHPAGIDNPNQFFVFAVDDADLPNFVAQQFTARATCDDVDEEDDDQGE